MITRENKRRIATVLSLVLCGCLALACGPTPAPNDQAKASTHDPNSPTGKLPAEATSPTPQVQTETNSADGAGGTNANTGNTAATPATSSTSSTAAPASTEKPKKISAAHVLIQYMGCSNAGAAVVRTKEQARTVAEKIRDRAKSGEDFSRLAVDYSDEPGAAQRGGSLGRFGHGQMVKPFEEAAFALQVNEISDVVETQFGFHIIKRTE
jgi:peptidyl-prolyl cis-trans isomerase NIMA-interacting 1